MPADTFDPVDEIQWEDLTEFLTLEEAGLENADCDTIGTIQRQEYYKGEDPIDEFNGLFCDNWFNE